MSPHAALRAPVRLAFANAERGLDRFFGHAENPIRHLGALGFLFLWVVTVSGIYLYAVIDTGVDAVYASVDWLTHEQWYLGGVMRSAHRYASDALVLLMMLHLLREWAYERYNGFRWYSWVTGVPLIWLIYISGIGGYWIVWDRLAQFSATATTELLDWLPIFADPTARNFLLPEAVNDRFFTFLVFLHIGVPLISILALWAHVHRISRVDHIPTRRVSSLCLGALLLLAILRPATSDAPADLLQVPAELRLDWFYLFLHPLTDWTSPAAVWVLLFGFTLLLFALPIISRRTAEPVAVVDAPNCNGCRRCAVDCPYAAVAMAPHPTKPRHEIAVVDAALCASCGICAGSCPSSTPFRHGETLVTGIDMPQQPVTVLRRQMEEKIARLAGPVRIVVFGCRQGADVTRLEDAGTAALPLICTGMLPPSFIEYALRGGADGIFITGCREGGCPFRLGNQWARERVDHRREPYLRPLIPRRRIRECWGDAADESTIAAALDEFRKDLLTLANDPRPTPYQRRASNEA